MYDRGFGWVVAPIRNLKLLLAECNFILVQFRPHQGISVAPFNLVLWFSVDSRTQESMTGNAASRHLVERQRCPLGVLPRRVSGKFFCR